MLEGQVGGEGLEREKFEQGQVLKETKKRKEDFFSLLTIRYGTDVGRTNQGGK